MAVTGRAVVVGGGITGLAAAWELAVRGVPVTLFEGSDRLGGKIATTTFAGVALETGPDTVLARVPWARALVSELGLEADVVHPATGRAYVWARSRLRPLPEGLVLGVPGRLGPLARSGILSPAGLARAGLDLVLPRGDGDDPSVAEVIGGRFGSEVLDRLVDPLVSGINAGRADRLSLRAVAPDVSDVAASSRSLLLGLRRRPRADPVAPVFLSFRGGLQQLVDTLAAALVERGVEVRTGEPVDALPEADAVVVTVPAPAAARLVGNDELTRIAHASVALATMAYPAGSTLHPLDASGFLVPRTEGWLMTAATFVTTKWPQRVPPGRIVIRCSCGRFGDARPGTLDDDALVRALHDELDRAVGLRSEPLEWRVDRWPDSFPQAEPGHLARVARVEASLPRHVAIAGAAYRGVGIASCIRQGREAAARLAGVLGR